MLINDNLRLNSCTLYKQFSNHHDVIYICGTFKRLFIAAKPVNSGTVVVAQLVEQSLPTAEVIGSNPVIGKILKLTYFRQLY